jgi:hypothetical protein
MLYDFYYDDSKAFASNDPEISWRTKQLHSTFKNAMNVL